MVGPRVWNRASYISEFKEIKSADQLAKFIYEKTSQNVQLAELLGNIHNTEKLRIPDYEAEIPVREIYGTIVEQRFGNELGKDLFQHDKKYAVRAICAFRDSKGDVWRFHIIEFEERQYTLMEQFLLKEIGKKESNK